MNVNFPLTLLLFVVVVVVILQLLFEINIKVNNLLFKY